MAAAVWTYRNKMHPSMLLMPSVQHLQGLHAVSGILGLQIGNITQGQCIHKL